MMNSAVLDPFGIYETILRFGWMLSVVGGALILFLYLWWNNRLDMDEKPKNNMLEMDEKHPSDSDEEKK